MLQQFKILLFNNYNLNSILYNDTLDKLSVYILYNTYLLLVKHVIHLYHIKY